MKSKILTWLGPSEFASESSDFKKHLRSHVPRTGAWIRNSEQHAQWHEHGESALWINGTPGSGKSVLAATLISDFATSSDAPVLYFFFRHANPTNRAPQQLVRDWLSQLLDFSSSVQCQLIDFMEKHPGPQDIDLDDLWSCLCSALSRLPRVYCVADALDEMERGNDWFLCKLVSLGQQRPSTLKVIFTSRQSPYIESLFRDSTTVNLNLNRRFIEQDIGTYANHMLQDLDKSTITSQDRDLAKAMIQMKATGVFLYASLMMQEVIRDLERYPLEELLTNLPVDMSGMYCRLLKEHSIQSKVSYEVQSLFLQCVTHAARPLRLLEVAEMVRSTNVGNHLDNVQEIKAIVRTACGPLLTILPDETLQVVHHSLTEFLLSDTKSNTEVIDYSYPVFRSFVIHDDMAMTLLRYIISSSKATQWSKDEKEMQVYTGDVDSALRDHFFMRYPLLQYATSRWMTHARKSHQFSSSLIETIDDFFNGEFDSFYYWHGIWCSSEQNAIKDAVVRPVHVAAYFGLESYLKSLWETGQLQTELADSIKRTPLSYASENGHLETVKLFLSAGADVNSHSIDGVAPIHYACRNSHTLVLKTLLNAGANPLDQTLTAKRREHYQPSNKIEITRRRFGLHPLQYACECGSTEILKEILKVLKPEDYQSGPIHWASDAGQAKIVAMLLHTGHVDPDLKDGDGNTPLCLAAHCQSPSTVGELLQAGADVKKTSDHIDRYRGLSFLIRPDGYTTTVTALHSWLCSGRRSTGNLQDFLDTGRLLLKAGCEINARDSKGKTPLFYWTNFRDSEWATAILQLLLDNGADGAPIDIMGNSILHKLTKWHTEPQIQRLIKAGGNMNTHRPTDGKTPLLSQFDREADEIIRDWHTYVEKYDVDPNAQDNRGRTVLHKALSQISWDISQIECWLRAGADPNVQDAEGRSCLFYLRNKDENEHLNKDLISLLLANGINLNALDHDGRNFALHAFSSKDPETFDRLQGFGVDLLIRDYQGKTALHILAGLDDDPDSFAPFMKYLADSGTGPNVTDHFGNTICHIAISSRGRFWEFHMDNAIAMGADPSIRNHEGKTVLHLAATLPFESQSFILYRGYEYRRLLYLFDLHHKLDVNALDHGGATPLHFAAAHDVCSTAVLLRAGASLSITDHKKRTVLHYAARGRNPNALGFLVTQIDVHSRLRVINAADHNGRAALHDAVRSGVLESVQILLNAGVNPNSRDSLGRNALHIASEIAEEQNLMLLQDSSRAVYFQNYDIGLRSLRRGWTRYSSHPAGLTLHDPTRHSHTAKYVANDDEPNQLTLDSVCRITEIVQLLLRAGCDTAMKDDNGTSPYDFAVANSQQEVALALGPEKSRPLKEDNCQRTVGQCSLAEVRVRQWSSTLEGLRKSVRDSIPRGDEATSMLLPAIQANDTRMVAELLSLGADPLQLLADGKTVLHTVARYGLLSIMELIYSHKTSSPLPSDLLHEIVNRETPNIEMLRFLVKHGLDPNTKAADGGDCSYEKHVTVMHILATARYWWYSLALDYLLESGADPELSTSSGKTVLQVAMDGESGFWKRECLDILLQRGVCVDCTDLNGSTPLMQACKEGTELVKLLLDHGASPFFGDQPPICVAIEAKNYEMVEAFIEAGIDCNSLCQDTRKANCRPLLLHAAINSPENIIELLIENGADPLKVLDDGTPLITAIIRSGGRLKPLLPPLLSDCYFEAKDSQGMTPLMAACTRPFSCCGDVTLLIEAGASTQATDHQQRTALHHVCAAARPYSVEEECEIAKRLLASGALIDALDADDFSPLHYSIQRRSAQMINCLLDDGANALLPYPKEDKTALHFLLPSCAHDGNTTRDRQPFMKLVKRFVEAGIDKEQPDARGNTAIFGYVAVRPTYDDLFELYQDSNDDWPDLDEQRRILSDYNIHARNKAGETPMHVVAKRSSEGTNVQFQDDTRDMFKLLLDLGADPKTEDAERRTPLDLAAAVGNMGVLDLFAPSSEPKMSPG